MQYIEGHYTSNLMDGDMPVNILTVGLTYCLHCPHLMDIT